MNVRINQEKTHQGMLSFQNSFRYLDESIRNTIEATNRNCGNFYHTQLLFLTNFVNITYVLNIKLKSCYGPSLF